MNIKETRTLKVYEGHDSKYHPIPQIHIQGKWLNDCGFQIGKELTILCEDNRLVITKRDEK